MYHGKLNGKIMPEEIIFSEEQIRFIIEAYKDDVRVIDIAKHLNVSITPIKKVLVNNNVFKPARFIKLKYKHLENILNKQYVENLYNELLDLKKMANHFECGKGMIAGMMKTHNILTLVGGNLRREKLNKTIDYSEKAIANDYLKGLTLTELEKKYKASHITIAKILKEYNVKKVGEKRMYNIKYYDIHNNKDIIEKLREESKSPEEFRKKLNCGKDETYNIMKKYNIRPFSIEENYINKIKDILNNKNEFSYINKNEDYVTLNHNKCNKNVELSLQTIGRICKNNFEWKYFCNHCYHPKATSYAENEISDFLQENGISILKKNYQLIQKELDIYIPEKNIAIEYCGLYWHSELYKSNNFHKLKYDLCKQKGIRLITIFEDEWINKKDIVKNKLLHICGKSKNENIFARKCIIKEIDKNIKDKFLIENHIQGSDISKINLGIFYNSELCGVATFSKINIAKGSKSLDEQHLELSRYATCKNVIGGLGKILNYLKKNYLIKELITFADLRWSDGNLYDKLKFVKISETKPNYWYLTDRCSLRNHRFKYRKNNLKKLLKTFDPNLSEHQNMLNNKIYRIYDCGNVKYSLTFPQNN